MKVLVFALTLAMILSVSGALAEGKIKLENKLSVGDRIVSENMVGNYVWANFKQVGGPLFEQTDDMETITTVDVMSIDENGMIDIKVASEISGTITESDNESRTAFIPATKQPLRLLKVAKNGKIIWSDIGRYELRHPRNPLRDIDDWLVYITERQSSPLPRLPDKEVGVGDSWTAETLIEGPDGGDLKITTRAKLFAIGKIGEYDCAWIQSEARLPFKFQLSGDFEGYSSITVGGTFVWYGRSYFAYEEGRVIRDKKSWNFMMMIDIPLQEGNAKSFFTTLGSSTSTTSLSRKEQ